MKRFVFWVWALCAAAPGFADQVTIDGVTWEYGVYSVGGTPYAAIKKASGVQGAVTVPATLGGAPVTELETGFLGMSGVFYGCTELTEVRWEEGCAIEKIGGYAFRGCTNLTRITIPPSVTKLGNQAFRGSGLETVTIPGTVKTLGAEVFAECPDLKTAVFEEGDELYDGDVGDGLFVACPELETVTLKRLQTLSDWFFLDCPKLTSVSLPATLREIKDGAFSLCPNIVFTLDAGVTRFSVENGLLRSATGLCYVPGNPERLEIPDGITDISGGICRGMTNLREVTVPDTLKSIGTFAFYGCTSLEEIDLSGTQVTTLPEGAFANCPALAWVRLPATFGSFMMDSTFAYSPNVRFEVAEACKSFSSDALGTLYDKDKTVLFIGPNVASFTVPETVTELQALCEQIVEDTDGKIAPFVYPGRVSGGYWDFIGTNWWLQVSGADKLDEFMQFGSPEVFNYADQDDPSYGKLRMLETFEEIIVDNRTTYTLRGSASKDHLAAQISFVQREAAMIPNGNWIEKESLSSMQDEVRMMAVPRMEEAEEGVSYNYSGQPDYMFIPAQASNKEGAKLFLAYMCRDDMLQLYTTYTGTPRPFDYDVSECEVSDFIQSCLDIWSVSETWFENSTSELWTANKIKKFNLGNPYTMLLANSDTMSAIGWCASEYMNVLNSWDSL